MLVSILPYDGVARSNLLLRMTNAPTNQVSGGQASMTNNARPSTVNDYMNFTGTQAVRFSNNGGNWHLTSPYSLEMEVFIDSVGTRWIATLGEGFGAGWPEWAISHNGTDIIFTSSTDNNSYTTNLPLVKNYNPKQWYRLGFMFYTVDSKTMIRGYVNGIKVFEALMPVPYTTANGMSIGSDWAYNTSAGGQSRIFKGRIRNVSIGRSLFWTV